MKKLILLDGALGTCLWERAESKCAVWRYNLEQPEIVEGLHRDYVAAGSDIIYTNTFGANADALKNSGYTVSEIVKAGVRLAKKAADGKAKIALSVGPLTGLLEPYGDITPEHAAEMFREQIHSGAEDAPDYIALETFMDIEMLRIAMTAADSLNIPLLCSMSFEKGGRTMMGNSPEDLISLGGEFKNTAAVGLNCSSGPELALQVIASFSGKTELPLIFKPNAGKPTFEDGKTGAEFDAETFANDILSSRGAGVVYAGGCCGTSPLFIRRIREKLDTEPHIENC